MSLTSNDKKFVFLLVKELVYYIYEIDWVRLYLVKDELAIWLLYHVKQAQVYTLYQVNLLLLTCTPVLLKLH